MSSIFSKIVSAVRSGAKEIGESIVDSKAIGIYTQEIEDARNHLAAEKQALTQAMAEQILCDREIQHLQQQIESHEHQALEALNKGNESLAETVVEKIAQLDQELAVQRSVKTHYSAHVSRLKGLTKKTEQTMRELERELTMVKTAQSVQKATESITQSYSSSATSLLNAKHSLQRIKQRQKTAEDHWKAEEELENKLSGREPVNTLTKAQMGNATEAKNAVLKRIRQRADK